MAPSLLSLPRELRLQIYRYLLCHDTWIWVDRGQHTMLFSTYNAIVRTCRQVYLEAMPVFYGENTFRYKGGKALLRSGNLGANLKYMKHLELEVFVSGEQAAEIVLFMLKRLIKCGCELQTFAVQENALCAVTWSMFNFAPSPWREIVASQEVIAAFVKLGISQSLAFSIWSFNTEDGIDCMSDEDLKQAIRGFANCVAFEKGMTVTIRGPSNKPGFEAATFMCEPFRSHRDAFPSSTRRSRAAKWPIQSLAISSRMQRRIQLQARRNQGQGR